MQKRVVFFNRFVELEELMRFIGAADIYLTPYLTESQITSGTLAYAFGAGNAVVALLRDESLRQHRAAMRQPLHRNPVLLARLRHQRNRQRQQARP